MTPVQIWESKIHIIRPTKTHNLVWSHHTFWFKWPWNAFQEYFTLPRTSDFKLHNAQWCTVVAVLRLTLRLRESIYFDKLFRAEPIKTVTLLWQNFVPLPFCVQPIMVMSVYFCCLFVGLFFVCLPCIKTLVFLKVLHWSWHHCQACACPMSLVGTWDSCPP